ncbi:Plant/T31B5-30 protein [Quillaja saponaria]|uniref:Plant/T31B5-30 protein n=1 Tax=Quillaja saponaria TaxID=32244 RepID=A0AAD7P8F1_QUISA|nr:Plant/T31B5-30 protein [Quillaja saponaria]
MALIGPPELNNPTLATAAESQTPAATGDPFMDQMVANFNRIQPRSEPPMGYTENGSATYLSTGLHPKTLACNVASFATFGYFKDLPEILYRLLEGSDVREIQNAEWQQRKRYGGSTKARSRVGPFNWRGGFGMRGRVRHSNFPKKSRRHSVSLPKEVRVLNAMAKAKAEKEQASAARKQKRIAVAKKVVQKYGRDPDFRFLYERVSDYFAECLKSDIELLNNQEVSKISLAAKWCPTIDSSFDRSTLLCESIAKKVFPRESYPEYQGIEDAHYAYRVRDRLRKQVLVPLRKVLELPEVYIGDNRWDLIPYNRVASVAMKLYKEKFLKHDAERFTKYIQDVRAGKKTIAAGALLPHEIIESLNDGDGGEVAELQWKRMVEDLLKSGKLKNCLAVCDVSGSMYGKPMEVAVALGLLVSELSEDPWKGKVITFSQNPQLHSIQGSDLKSKTKFVRTMEAGMNTDFQKVFDLILQVAVEWEYKTGADDQEDLCV